MTCVERMKSRLLMQFGDKKLINALLEAFGQEFDELAQVHDDLKRLRWIDSSFGAQLDGCGDIVGQGRIINKALAIPYFGFPGHGNRGFGQLVAL